MARPLRAVRVVHPFPSLLNTALVVALAVVAGATPLTATALALGMLGIQFCIGTVNDICDATLDAQAKPWKPLPSGLVSLPTARAVAVICGLVGIGAATTQGLVVGLMALAMLGCGLLYDMRLKPTPWAWACFSGAFAILPIYAWFGSTGSIPPLSQFVVPLALLAGPALQLSNSLVDLERDEAAGVRTLAARLGRRRALIVIAVLLLVIYGLAWVTLSVTRGQLNFAVGAATVCAAVGVVLQARPGVTAREAGWSLEAGGIALLGVGWLSAVA